MRKGVFRDDWHSSLAGQTTVEYKFSLDWQVECFPRKETEPEPEGLQQKQVVASGGQRQQQQWQQYQPSGDCSVCFHDFPFQVLFQTVEASFWKAKVNSLGGRNTGRIEEAISPMAETA